MHGPVSSSAIFTLIGARPGEGCVIERTPQRAWVRPAPAAAAAAAAIQWQASDLRGRTRAEASPEPHLYMSKLLNNPIEDGLGWLSSPLLNTATRLAATLDAASSHVTVQEYETTGTATLPLSPSCDGRKSARKQLTDRGGWL